MVSGAARAREGYRWGARAQGGQQRAVTVEAGASFDCPPSPLPGLSPSPPSASPSLRKTTNLFDL